MQLANWSEQLLRVQQSQGTERFYPALCQLLAQLQSIDECVVLLFRPAESPQLLYQRAPLPGDNFDCYLRSAWLIYASATIVYQIFWSFVVPVMMGIFNDVDPSGRLIVFCLSAFKVGLMLGPPIAALAISASSLSVVLPLGGAAIVLSAICLQLAQRRAE